MKVSVFQPAGDVLKLDEPWLRGLRKVSREARRAQAGPDPQQNNSRSQEQRKIPAIGDMFLSSV